MGERIERIKIHIEEHKIAYSIAITTVVVAGITCLIMRRVVSQPVRGAIGVPAQGAIGVLGDRIEINNDSKILIGTNKTLNNVSYILSNRQGPPSWVVRCLETGDLFTSQKSAATEMGLSAAHLSEHLNGLRDHVDNFHFERICMAA